MKNSKVNADKFNIPNDYRLMVGLDSLQRIFEELHYENRKATIILHPTPGGGIEPGLTKAIIDCPNIRDVFLFARYPEIEAFHALSLFLKPLGISSKQENVRRPFRLQQQAIFDLSPDNANRLTQFVYYLIANKKS